MSTYEHFLHFCRPPQSLYSHELRSGVDNGIFEAFRTKSNGSVFVIVIASSAVVTFEDGLYKMYLFALSWYQHLQHFLTATFSSSFLLTWTIAHTWPNVPGACSESFFMYGICLYCFSVLIWPIPDKIAAHKSLNNQVQRWNACPVTERIQKVICLENA